MHIKKLTFYGVYATLMILAIIGLIIFGCCGCATSPAFTTVSGRPLFSCEREAIKEEVHGMTWGIPVFRIHTIKWDASKEENVGHALNYEILSDGSRKYYDVVLNKSVPAPDADTYVRYDSFDVRVKDGITNPPTPEICDWLM